MRNKLSQISVGLLGLSLASCVSPKFERAWKDSPQQRWTGQWYSEKHHAGGRLRAVLSSPTAGKMDAFFEARWQGFTTAYPVTLDAQKQGAGFQIAGQKELKSFVGGGLYTYKGSLLPSKFEAQYGARNDAGTFQLTPAP